MASTFTNLPRRASLLGLVWTLPWVGGALRYARGGDFVTREMARLAANVPVAALAGLATAWYLRARLVELRLYDASQARDRQATALVIGCVVGSLAGELALTLPFVGEALGSLGHGASATNPFDVNGRFLELLLVQAVFGLVAWGTAVAVTSLVGRLVRAPSV